jgi:ABC-type transport system involved in cytochrome c biogenesis ATPase subunit
MWPIRRTREPLYGRFNLTLPVFPFRSGGFPLVKRHSMRNGTGKTTLLRVIAAVAAPEWRRRRA